MKTETLNFVSFHNDAKIAKYPRNFFPKREKNVKLMAVHNYTGVFPEGGKK